MDPAAPSLSLAAGPGSSGEARRFVRARVGELGFHRLVDDVALVVSELVTNVMLHAQGPSRVSVYLRHGRVRLEVADDSSNVPERRGFSDHAVTGRGLTLVESLSASWGTTVSPMGGKVVWADFDIIADVRRTAPA